MGNYTSLNPCIAEKIWMPDIFIDQAKSVRTPKYFMKTAAVRYILIFFPFNKKLTQRIREFKTSNILALFQTCLFTSYFPYFIVINFIFQGL